MNDGTKRALKSLAWGLYVAFVVVMVFFAFLASFLSDGHVPEYIHIVFPLYIGIVFGLPPLLWHLIRSNKMRSPLPMRLRKYEEKIIVIFLALWGVAMAVGYYHHHHK